MQALADFLQHARRRYSGRTKTIGACAIAGGEIGFGADGDRADDRGAVEEALDQRRAAAGLCWIQLGVDRHGAFRHGNEAATQQIEARFDLLAEVAGNRIAGRAEQRVFDPIAAVDDHHDVLVIEILQPFADAAVGPLRIEAVAQIGRRLQRRGCAFDLAQHDARPCR